MLATKTGWCRPWEVAEVVPARWADRFWAVQAAKHQEPEVFGPGETTRTGNVTKTRIA